MILQYCKDLRAIFRLRKRIWFLLICLGVLRSAWLAISVVQVSWIENEDDQSGKPRMINSSSTNRTEHEIFELLDNATSPAAESSLSQESTVASSDPDFLISDPSLCANSDRPLLLVFVLSSPNRLNFRRAIRETWGNPKAIAAIQPRNLRMQLLFVIGKNSSDAEQMSNIVVEHQQYRDILQLNTEEHYRGLVDKDLGWLKWTSTYCPNAFQILKTDDDVFLNTYALSRIVDEYFENEFDSSELRAFPSPGAIRSNARSITCAEILRDRGVFRNDPRGESHWYDKWIVTEEEFPGTVYPTYCGGAFYMLSGDLPELLYQESILMRRKFWLEDVYVTGMLAERVSAITYRTIGGQYFFDPMKTDLRKAKKTFRKDTMVIAHLGAYVRWHYEMWNAIERNRDVQ